jgi:arrestin-1
VVDDEYIRDQRKVFGQIICHFRYGREEDEVMGLNFQKELTLASEQIFPRPEKEQRETSKLQERLLKKLGPNAFPFTFTLPPSAPASIQLQQSPNESGDPCGVQYFVKMFAGDSETDRTHKRSTVALGIRKVQFAPSKTGAQPCTVVRKDFMLSPGELELEVTLDKQLYHHGEKIAINICIRNNSNKVESLSGTSLYALIYTSFADSEKNQSTRSTRRRRCLIPERTVPQYGGRH